MGSLRARTYPSTRALQLPFVCVCVCVYVLVCAFLGVCAHVCVCMCVRTLHFRSSENIRVACLGLADFSKCTYGYCVSAVSGNTGERLLCFSPDAGSLGFKVHLRQQHHLWAGL